MSRRNAVPHLILILASLHLASGCATLTRRGTQGIPVTSYPPGASVSVNGDPQGVTPLVIRAARSEKGQIIRIEYPGYDPCELRLIRKASGAYFLSNCFLGLAPAVVPVGLYSLANHGEGGLWIWAISAAAFGGIFTLVDSGSGAINDFEPKEITVALKRSVGTPHVDTMLLDIEDLRNVKWIRIRGD